MSLVWLVLAGASAGVAGLCVALTRRGRADWHAWARVAHGAGLREAQRRWVGAIDGIDVEIVRHRVVGIDWVEIVAESRWIPANIRISPRSREDLAHGGVWTQDSAFDRALRSEGEEALLVGLLDGETRLGLLTLAQHRFEVRNGCIRVALPVVADEWRAQELLSRTMDTAKRLELRHTAPTLLLRAAMTERLSPVRSNARRLLLERFPHAPESRVVDDEWEEPITLAKALRTGAFELLDSVVRSPSQPRDARVEALDCLALNHPWSKAQKTVMWCLARPPARLRQRAVRIVGSERHAAAGPALVALLDGSGGVELAHVVAALERIASPLAEEALIAELAREGGEVRREAIRALGLIGGHAAIGPLAAIATHYGTADGIAARRSLRRLRSRVSGLGAGRLSVAEPDLVGAVMLVEPDRRV